MAASHSFERAAAALRLTTRMLLRLVACAFLLAASARADAQQSPLRRCTIDGKAVRCGSIKLPECITTASRPPYVLR